MALDFHSPSYRAATSDLTIQISPLGLVELADEECGLTASLAPRSKWTLKGASNGAL
jgi:hypothetical protein